MVHQNLTMHYGSPELVLAEQFSRTCPFNMVHQNLTMHYGSPELVLAEWFSRTFPFNMVYEKLFMQDGSPKKVSSIWFTISCPCSTIYALTAIKYIRRIATLSNRILTIRYVMPPSFTRFSKGNSTQHYTVPTLP